MQMLLDLGMCRKDQLSTTFLTYTTGQKRTLLPCAHKELVTPLWRTLIALANPPASSGRPKVKVTIAFPRICCICNNGTLVTAEHC